MSYQYYRRVPGPAAVPYNAVWAADVRNEGRAVLLPHKSVWASPTPEHYSEKMVWWVRQKRAWITEDTPDVIFEIVPKHEVPSYVRASAALADNAIDAPDPLASLPSDEDAPIRRGI